MFPCLRHGLSIFLSLSMTNERQMRLRGELSQQGTTALKNEYSIAEEIGYRYAGPSLSGAVTAFSRGG